MIFRLILFLTIYSVAVLASEDLEKTSEAKSNEIAQRNAHLEIELKTRQMNKRINQLLELKAKRLRKVDKDE